MTLSKRSVELLVDLVEIKLNSLIVMDREDLRERKALERCRKELLGGRGETDAPRGEPARAPNAQPAPVAA